MKNVLERLGQVQSFYHAQLRLLSNLNIKKAKYFIRLIVSMQVIELM